MWSQHYTPIAGSLGASALVAALPVFALLYLLGVKRKPAWAASVAGLAAAVAVALFCYRMPPVTMLSAIGYGAAIGLFPIGWVVFCALLLYRITVETGKFDILKDSIGSLTADRRLQALLIAFAFGAFIEGAAGFGTPVVVAAAMLTGLGFSPFYAAGICLLANTAPVAFGSIGIPILTLNKVVPSLSIDQLSATVGRICAPVSLIIPAYLMLVMCGWRGLRGVLLGTAVCGVSFAGTQFLVSNYVGPQLTDILSSLAAISSLVILFLLWKPKDGFRFEGEASPLVAPRRHSARELALAWGPYGLLVVFVLLWGCAPVRHLLERGSVRIPWPGLHDAIWLMPHVVSTPQPYHAFYDFNWLSASGTACLLAAISSALLLGMPPRQFAGVFLKTVKQLLVPELTIATVLALAFLMNYSGATATLGLAFAATGVLFPFFSALLGWLGVFLTGSDTSSNALFGNLQVITADTLHYSRVLMAAANSSGGVMGKMISLQSIAVAAAATGLGRREESRLFRFTLGHSIILASLIGLITALYAYTGWAG
ncbi:MAG: lactate permease LctP family transporter [Bryobacteraceae bacterium]|jgi:lactate permease